MSNFLSRFTHPGRARRGAEVAAIYLKHGITEYDVERVAAEMERASKEPAYEPNYSDWMKVGAAQQRVQMELQEKGFIDATPPSEKIREAGKSLIEIFRR